MYSANQIAVFFNHQYFWRESSDLLDFLHGENHQAKVASRITSFGLGLLVVSFIHLSCRILWSSVSLKGIKLYLSFSAWSSSSREHSTSNYSFNWIWRVVPLVQSNIRILWSSMSLEEINQSLRFFAWR